MRRSLNGRAVVSGSPSQANRCTGVSGRWLRSCKAGAFSAGDRVALVGENRWEWPVVDFAVLAVGAADVPLYQTLTPEQMGYILNNSGAKAIFVSTKDQYEKLLKVSDKVTTVEHVVVWDDGQFTGAENFSEIMKRAPELEARDEAFDQMLRSTKPDELASLIYTSGTTGEPKGVMLTHDNMATNLQHSTDDLHIEHGRQLDLVSAA